MSFCNTEILSGTQYLLSHVDLHVGVHISLIFGNSVATQQFFSSEHDLEINDVGPSKTFISLQT